MDINIILNKFVISVLNYADKCDWSDEVEKGIRMGSITTLSILKEILQEEKIPFNNEFLNSNFDNTNHGAKKS